ncbi:MAG: transposase, partial [Proteobacteria bacterium]|nr:transposase [Pseudomonadota bacterium]
TSWKNGGKLHWLWVMVGPLVAFFMIHPNRSQKAFEELIGYWNGILVSDNYAVYRKWTNLRQTCLAHLIRQAKALALRKDPELAACGKWARDELQRLCKMAHEPPSRAEWSASSPGSVGLSTFIAAPKAMRVSSSVCWTKKWSASLSFSSRPASSQPTTLRNEPSVSRCSGANAASALTPTRAAAGLNEYSRSGKPAASTISQPSQSSSMP